MTIDLRTARPGCEVTTHAGAKLKVLEVIILGRVIKLHFKGYTGSIDYDPLGRVNDGYGIHWMDIVSITPPPLTEAERLAEIARIARRLAESGDLKKVQDILALAEGRSHD